MASNTYDSFHEDLPKKLIDWVADTNIKALVVGTGYTPNKGHLVVSDVVANEVSGTGYSRKTLANKTLTRDSTNHREVYNADALTYTGTSGWTGAYLIIFRDSGADATSRLVACLDFPDVSGGDITLTPPASGSGGMFYVAA